MNAFIECRGELVAGLSVNVGFLVHLMPIVATGATHAGGIDLGDPGVEFRDENLHGARVVVVESKGSHALVGVDAQEVLAAIVHVDGSVVRSQAHAALQLLPIQ